MLAVGRTPETSAVRDTAEYAGSVALPWRTVPADPIANLASAGPVPANKISPRVVRGVPASANPVIFVMTPEAGVPKAGVTIVHEVTRQKFPDPEVFPAASEGVTTAKLGFPAAAPCSTVTVVPSFAKSEEFNVKATAPVFVFTLDTGAPGILAEMFVLVIVGVPVAVLHVA